MMNQGTKELTKHFLESLILPIGLISVKVWSVIVPLCEVSAFQGTPNQSSPFTTHHHNTCTTLRKGSCRCTEGPNFNQYLLVVQDYFSKWPFAFPMRDQKAETIVQILQDDVFTVIGPPRKLHSDCGRNSKAT